MGPGDPAERELRADVVRVCRRMAERGFVSGWAGNVSARLAPDRFLLTPSGVPKADVAEDDLLVVDASGRVVGASDGRRPTSELPMHLCAYRLRPDVSAVVHAHPVHAVALSIVGSALSKNYVPEAVVMLGPVAVTPYATPSTAENEHVVAAVVEHHDAVVLRSHGSLTVGRTLDEAYLRLETLEHAAQIVMLVEQAGGGRELDAAAMEKLVAQRKRLGLWREPEPGLVARR
jgi:L-fuculose-phosphate aldolase